MLTTSFRHRPAHHITINIILICFPPWCIFSSIIHLISDFLCVPGIHVLHALYSSWYDSLHTYPTCHSRQLCNSKNTVDTHLHPLATRLLIRIALSKSPVLLDYNEVREARVIGCRLVRNPPCYQMSSSNPVSNSCLQHRLSSKNQFEYLNQ